MGENLVKQESYFTRREWILRYSSPFKSLMFMAGPMIVIMLVNSLYGIIDKQLTLNLAVDEVTRALNGAKVNGFPAIWSPNLLIDGDQELFAKQLINVSTQYSNTIIQITDALSLFTVTGTGIRFGQAMGARDRDRMNNVMISGFIQTVILIVASTVILSFVYPYILTSQAGTDYSDRYSSWQFALSNEYSQMFVFGMPLLALSNFLITLLRTEGKVWIVIINNVICVFLNVIFGIIFMEVLDLGMKGAVFASMVAWGFSVVMSLIVIFTSKDTFLRPNFRRFVWSNHDAMRIWVIGISPLLSMSIFAIVSYLSTILITNLHDFSPARDGINKWLLTVNGKPVGDIPDDLKAYLGNYNVVTVLNPDNHYQVSEHISNSLRIMSATYPWLVMIYAPILGMSQGASVNYAYNVGANKRKKIVQIFKIHILVNLIWMIFVEILINSAGKEMMLMFGYTGDNYYWSQIFLAPLIFATLTQATISMFQGLGNPRNAFIVTIFRASCAQVLFIVIGWAIARSISTDGSKDWVMFLMNGLQEVPAFVLALIMSLVMINNWKITGQLINVPDTFEKPSIINVIQGEYQTTIRKEENVLKNRLKRMKDHNYDAKKIVNYEETIALKIESFRFINEGKMNIRVSHQAIKEARIKDNNSYKNAEFSSSNAIETAKSWTKIIMDIKTNIVQKFKELNVQKEKYQKLDIANVRGQLTSLSWEEKMLIKLSTKIESTLISLNNDVVIAEEHFKKSNDYFKAHKEKILKTISIRNQKIETKKVARLEKEENDRKKYEIKFAAHPEIAERNAKHIEKVKKNRQKEVDAYNKHSIKFREIIARREEKREQKIAGRRA